MPFAVDQKTLFFPFTFGLGMNVIPLIMLWDALNTVCFILLNYLRSKIGVAVVKRLLEMPAFLSAKRVAVYVSCAKLREVDTRVLLQHLLQYGTCS